MNDMPVYGRPDIDGRLCPRIKDLEPGQEGYVSSSTLSFIVNDSELECYLNTDDLIERRKKKEFPIKICKCGERKDEYLIDIRGVKCDWNVHKTPFDIPPKIEDFNEEALPNPRLEDIVKINFADGYKEKIHFKYADTSSRSIMKRYAQAIISENFEQAGPLHKKLSKYRTRKPKTS